MRTFSIAYELRLRAGDARDPLVVARGLLQDWWARKSAGLSAEARPRFAHRERDLGDEAHSVELVQLTTDGRRWQTRVRARRADDERVWFSVTMSVDATSDAAAEAAYFVETPHFVRNLFGSFKLTHDGEELSHQAASWTTSEDAARLAARVLSPERTMPLVLIAHPADREPDEHRALAALLADYLAGVATVHELSSRASYAFTDALPSRQHSCFDGGVRLYLPFDLLGAEPDAHRLWTHARLTDISDLEATNPRGKYRRLRFALMERVLRHHARWSRVPGAVSGVSWRELEHRALFRELGAANADELREQRAKLINKVSEGEELLAEADRELAELRKRLDASEQRVVVLQSRLEGALAALGAEDTAQNTTRPERHFDTVDDAVAAARLAFADTLDLSQLKTNTNLPPVVVYDYLSCLHQLCLRQRAGLGRNKGQTLLDMVRERIHDNPTYKKQETGYLVTNPRTKLRVDVDERIHIQDGKKARSESIYWVEDGTGDALRYIVAVIGRHV